jgi:membrane dipeptidase
MHMKNPARTKLAATLALSAALAGQFAWAADTNPAEAALVKKARAIHQHVLTLDTHNDIDTNNFGFSRNYGQDLDNQVTLPKMVKGGLDASFFIVYTGQVTSADAFEAAGYKRAYDTAIDKFEAIRRMTAILTPNQIEFASTAADVRRIHGKGKKVALIGVENGYPLGDEKTAVRRVKEFYDRGARYLSLAHQGNNQLSDSNTGELTGWKWNGVSPLGKLVLAEMNKVGIMIDVSHPSKESMMQALKISQAPIIASHSAVRALADVSRNMDDEQMLALKANGGVMQVVAFDGYLKADSAERRVAVAALREELKLPPTMPLQVFRRGSVTGYSEEQRTMILQRLTELDAKLPPPVRATVADFVNHIDYAVKKMGIDHVGISSDFDGGGGINGWNDAGETFNVTLELVRRGYTEAQIAKLWGGNLLRVMGEVEKVAQRLAPRA